MLFVQLLSAAKFISVCHTSFMVVLLCCSLSLKFTMGCDLSGAHVLVVAT